MGCNDFIYMYNEQKIIKTINDARKNNNHKFKQSLELILIFKDIDVKKGFSINEVIQLPKQTSSPSTICVLAAGDIGLKAKNSKVDNIDNSELVQLGTNKRAIRKFANKYDFFLADTKLMPAIGKILGQFLGPRGKMPSPIPFNTSIESILTKFRSSIRIRVRGSSALSCKIGDEDMTNEDIASNANTVINSIEKKLPNGDKNIKKIFIKTTMGKIIRM